MNRIVIISDCEDVAFNEIIATIQSFLKKGELDKVKIEPLVKAKEFSIVNAAFLLRLMAECYDPKNTIFLIIVNPLRTDRRERARIMGITKNGFKFIGENTGVLSWIINDFGLKCVYEFNRENLTGKDFISFGGKYFYAPMTANIVNGKKMEKLGKKFNKNLLINLDIKDGSVVHIDNFNVAKIKGKIPKEWKEGDDIEILMPNNKKLLAKFTNSMKDLPDNTLAIFRGSSLNNLPEIGKVRSTDGVRNIGIKIGDILIFKKNEKN